MKMKPILVYCKQALLLTLVMTVLLSGIVPLVFTFISQVVFPTASHGSLIEKDGKVIGSELLGQNFTADKYFWGRLSATTPPYNAAASAASNLSMGNITLLERANERMQHLAVGKKIPISLVTASGSGLDPHISPLAAYFQGARVAKARGMTNDQMKKFIDEHTEAPYLGFIGNERVNVLELNLALDAAHGK